MFNETRRISAVVEVSLFKSPDPLSGQTVVLIIYGDEVKHEAHEKSEAVGATDTSQAPAGQD